MIKPQQLRIGNYCQDKISGEWLIVDELNKDNVGFYIVNRDKYPLQQGWEAEFIPLVEKIMNQFGFMYEYVEGPIYENGEQEKGYYQWKLNNFCFHSNKNKDVIYGQLIIKYVHTLQNLYYALTEYELCLLK